MKFGLMEEMSFNDVSNLELYEPLVQWTGIMCNIGRRHQDEQSRELFKFGPEVQVEMPFKSISYLELW